MEELNRIKRDIVLSVTKYSISGGEEQNHDAVLNSVLHSWFSSVQSVKDFYLKYHSFKQLDQIIRESYLFDIVEVITSTKERDADQVRRALLIYDSFSNDMDYQKLANTCGYKIPKEFGMADAYSDDGLKQKVEFYYSFRNRLSEIAGNLARKGVALR